MRGNAIATDRIAIGVTGGVVYSLTLANIRKDGVNSAFVTVEASAVRYKLDGTPPSTTTGHILNPGDKIVFHGGLEKIRFHLIAAPNAMLQVTYGSDLAE